MWWKVKRAYDGPAVKEICYDCGSPMAKRSYNYFRRIAFVGGDKVWCQVWYDDLERPAGFFYATRCRDHVRLIEIAVRSEHQGKGLGKSLLFSLLTDARAAGLYKVTFRTPRHEGALDFWTHMGAQIVDVKGGADYEMEIKIKK